MITTEQIETIRKALLTEQSHKMYAENHLEAMKVLNELEKLASNTEIIGSVSKCKHPRDKRSYIGNNMLKCGVCNEEFK